MIVLAFLLSLKCFSAPEVLVENKWWAKSFDSTSQQILFAGVGLVLVARTQDDTFRENWMDHRLMDEKTSRVGDLLGTGVPGLILVGSQYFLDRDNGLAHASSLVSTTLWTYGLKTAAHRQRPGNSNNYQSFPSGHTSTTFATATSLAYSYGWKVGVPAYALAVGTGLSRMADDVHYFSDVVAGAVIGLWLGRAYHPLSKSNPEDPVEKKDEDDLQSLQIIPSLSHQGASLYVLLNF